MKSFTKADIDSWFPCYNPNRHIPEDWSGTALDMLKCEQVPASDRLWVVLRNDLIPADIIQHWSIWCARQAEDLMRDERSIKALTMHERFLNGKATLEEWQAASAEADKVILSPNHGASSGAAHHAAQWDTNWIDKRNLNRNEIWGEIGCAAWLRARHASRAITHYINHPSESYASVRAQVERIQISHLILMLS